MKTKLLLAGLVLLQTGFLVYYLFHAAEPHGWMNKAQKTLAGEYVFLGNNEARINAETVEMITHAKSGYDFLAVMTALTGLASVGISVWLLLHVLRGEKTETNAAQA